MSTAPSQNPTASPPSPSPHARWAPSGGCGRCGVVLKGVVFVRTPFHFRHAEPHRANTLNAVFGPGLIEQRAPLGLLRALHDKGQAQRVLGDLRMLLLTAELDSEPERLAPGREFAELCRDAGLGHLLEVRKVEGHNPISPVVALGTGVEREEAWWVEVLRFCNVVGAGDGGGC